MKSIVCQALTFPCLCDPLFLFCRFEYLERAHESIVYTHHSTRIIELATIVRRTKNGHKLSARKKLVTVLHHLVSPADQVQVVSAQEVRHHVFSEGERHPPVVLAPPHNVLVRVRPQQVAQ